MLTINIVMVYGIVFKYVPKYNNKLYYILFNSFFQQLPLETLKPIKRINKLFMFKTI